MKILNLLLAAFLLLSCNREEVQKDPVVITVHATSRRKGGSDILNFIGGHVIQLRDGKCKLKFELIKLGEIESLGEAKFDSSLGKVAYVTPAILDGGKCAIDAYIPELKVTQTYSSYSQRGSVGILTYEFDRPETFGAMKLFKTFRLEKTSLVFAYYILHNKEANLEHGVDESIDTMLQRSKEGDISFLAIVAEPVE